MSERKHNHYFKSVEGLKDIDVYRVLWLFNVTDPCLQHAIKKLLVAGGRGGGKDISRDVQEAADTLARWQEMRQEEAAKSKPFTGSELDAACELPTTATNAQVAAAWEQTAKSLQNSAALTPDIKLLLPIAAKACADEHIRRRTESADK